MTVISKNQLTFFDLKGVNLLFFGPFPALFRIFPVVVHKSAKPRLCEHPAQFEPFSTFLLSTSGAYVIVFVEHGGTVLFL
ncbi:hypothetical protein NE584_15315 [Clostridium sp. DFI.5.61]|nr:hypothetical protein [Clostridium sp. DFI.5.61]